MVTVKEAIQIFKCDQPKANIFSVAQDIEKYFFFTEECSGVHTVNKLTGRIGFVRFRDVPIDEVENTEYKDLIS